MADLTLYENGNGGTLENTANDLALNTSLWNQPYLALFGGQYEQSTPIREEDLDNTIERFDWWGNSIAFPDEPNLQFNSETERMLDQMTLNDEDLLALEKTVMGDLQYLSEIADIEVTVTRESPNRVAISIRMIEPDTLDERNFVFLWDGTRVEEIINAENLPPLPRT